MPQKIKTKRSSGQKNKEQNQSYTYGVNKDSQNPQRALFSCTYYHHNSDGDSLPWISTTDQERALRSVQEACVQMLVPRQRSRVARRLARSTQGMVLRHVAIPHIFLLQLPYRIRTCGQAASCVVGDERAVWGQGEMHLGR